MIVLLQCQTDLQHKSKHDIFSYSLSFHILVNTEDCTSFFKSGLTEM